VWSAEGFADLVGRDAIAAGLAGLAADRVLWSIHYMVSPLIELAADLRSGRCHWYLWELCTMAPAAAIRRTPARPTPGSAAGTTAMWCLRLKGGAFQSELDVRLQGEAVPSWQFKKPVNL
jgi:hypothetical protein